MLIARTWRRRAGLAAMLLALASCDDLPTGDVGNAGAGDAPATSPAATPELALASTAAEPRQGDFLRRLLADPGAEDATAVGDEAAPGAAPARPAGGGFFASLFAPRDTLPADPDAPIAQTRLVGGEVIVAGPSGYCIDPETLQRGRETGFAVLASCRILSPDGVGPIVAPGLVTVTVGRHGSANPLPSASGLAASAGGATLSAFESRDLALVHMASGGRSVLSDGDDRYWRAAFVVGDRIVGLALYAPRDGALAGESGAALLRAVRDEIRRRSPR